MSRRLPPFPPDPSQRELQVVAGQATNGGEPRPDDQTGGENIAPIRAVGQQGDRNAERHIKESYRRAGEDGHARIGEVQFQAIGSSTVETTYRSAMLIA